MLFLLSILHDQQLHTAIKHFAEPEEATNCATLSSPVYLYVCMYIHHGQVRTPQLRNCLCLSKASRTTRSYSFSQHRLSKLDNLCSQLLPQIGFIYRSVCIRCTHFALQPSFQFSATLTVPAFCHFASRHSILVPQTPYTAPSGICLLCHFLV